MKPFKFAFISALTVAAMFSAADARAVRVPSGNAAPAFTLTIPDDWTSQFSAKGNGASITAADHSAALIVSVDLFKGTVDEYAHIQFSAAKGADLKKGALVVMNGFKGYRYTFQITGQAQPLNVGMIVLQMGPGRLGACSIITAGSETAQQMAAGNKAMASLKVLVKP